MKRFIRDFLLLFALGVLSAGICVAFFVMVLRFPP